MVSCQCPTEVQCSKAISLLKKWQACSMQLSSYGCMREVAKYERSVLMQTWARFHGWFTMGLATLIWPPRSKGENEWHHGQTMCCTFCVHLLTSFLFFFVASFIVFNVLEFSWNWFFTLIAFYKKVNAVPMQTRVIFFGRATTNYIIAKHVYTRWFAFWRMSGKLRPKT